MADLSLGPISVDVDKLTDAIGVGPKRGEKRARGRFIGQQADGNRPKALADDEENVWIGINYLAFPFVI